MNLVEESGHGDEEDGRDGSEERVGRRGLVVGDSHGALLRNRDRGDRDGDVEGRRDGSRLLGSGVGGSSWLLVDGCLVDGLLREGLLLGL